MDNKTQKQKKELVGQVVSTKMNKTVVVAVPFMRRHPLYKKTLRRIRRYSVHNELKDIKEGDVVRVVETRPISKTKHFMVVGKVKAGQ